jgi:plasmid stabilization system protein ParE
VYKLRYKQAIESVWNSLPDEARAEFDRAILQVCEDPYATTKSRNHDDPRDVRRTLTLRHTRTILVIFNTETVKRVRILRITHLG